METQIEKINRLKKERNAVILAHYYQEPEIQDVADFTGDSLALAQAAKKTDASVILFCGVHFMAETAKILNPEKIVIIPDMDAGCSLANSAPAHRFKAWKEEHPGHKFISYINCSAEVKAMSDIICTSSNVEKIIDSIPFETPICFAPDKYLGNYFKKKTGREMVLWNGSCQVHEVFSETEVINLMSQYPNAPVLAHPECTENLLAYADFIGSTSSIIREATTRSEKQFIILTEPGVIHQMKKKCPDKEFIAVGSIGGCACNMCPYMRLNTIDKMVSALETLEPQINLSPELIEKALIPLERMFQYSN